MDVTVRPRVTTLVPLRDLLGRDATARELSTHEGELAIIGSATTSDREHAVAIVGANPALVIDATGAPGETLAHVTALVDELGTGLGPARRRWFRYSPPAGWYGLRRHGVTVYLAPEHPRVPGVLHIFDARPFLGGDAETFEQCLSLAMPPGFTATDDGSVATLRTPHGLEGPLRTVAGTREGHAVTRLATTLGDDRYCYCAHFEGDATLVETVTATLDSFQPLPIAAAKLPELAL